MVSPEPHKIDLRELLGCRLIEDVSFPIDDKVWIGLRYGKALNDQIRIPTKWEIQDRIQIPLDNVDFDRAVRRKFIKYDFIK